MLKRFLAIALVAAGIAAAAFWFNQNPPGVTMINPARPPEPILEPSEVEKIRTLQNTKEVYLLGGVSPDDKTIMVMAGTGEDSAQAFWLDLQTGQFESIDSKLLEFSPQGDLAWSDEQTVVYLSNNVNGDPVLVTIQRATDEIQTSKLARPKPYLAMPGGVVPSRLHGHLMAASWLSFDMKSLPRSLPTRRKLPNLP
jgi:hypothetical protein